MMPAAIRTTEIEITNEGETGSRFGFNEVVPPAGLVAAMGDCFDVRLP